MTRHACTIPGCDVRDHRIVRGYCQKHYARWLRYGDPNHKPVRPVRPVKIVDGVGVVELTRGRSAIIDAADAEEVGRYNWHVVIDGHRAYARSTLGGSTLTGLHSFLMVPPDGMVVDHIDHDGLNNRRNNLRLVTPHQNSMNQRPNRGTSSKHRGVTRRTEGSGGWVAQIQVDGKNNYLGYFHSERDAALAYDEAAREAFGEYAVLNFPLVEVA
ncbi:MAG TPA: HNH endonuclease [Acidimicrobiia bacterium]